MRFFNFFLNHMVQKYQNGIAPIFYYGISIKTNRKDQKYLICSLLTEIILIVVLNKFTRIEDSMIKAYLWMSFLTTPYVTSFIFTIYWMMKFTISFLASSMFLKYTDTFCFHFLNILNIMRYRKTNYRRC